MNKPHAYIIRGVSGSGKTTLARKMFDAGMIYAYVEADFYMTDDSGNYKFDSSRLSECHSKCFDAFKRCLNDRNDIAVCNTFTRHWEMKPYIEFCEAYKIPYTVIVCQGNFQNVHGVPDHVVENMRKRFEY